MATHSSVLAWRIPGMGKPGGVTQSQTRLKQLSSSSSRLQIGLPGCLSGRESTCQCWRWFDAQVGKIAWRRKWLHSLVFLPEKSHGQRSLVDYTPESDTT